MKGEEMIGRSPDWGAAHRMVEAARGWFERERHRVQELLDESDQRLKPLTDPLRTDFGVHRWLKSQREEAYSDWLAWILERLGSAGRILRVLGINEPQAVIRCGRANAEVKRERWVAEGHTGRQGRMDILVLIPGIVVIGVEVKLGPAERADTEKHRGYVRWLEDRPEPYKKRVLIAAKGDQAEYNQFVLRDWCSLCLQLRDTVLDIRDQGDMVLAAMTLAFVGAVENNLLRLGTANGPVLDTATGEHIHRWLREEGTHGS